MCRTEGRMKPEFRRTLGARLTAGILPVEVDHCLLCCSSVSPGESEVMLLTLKPSSPDPLVLPTMLILGLSSVMSHMEAANQSFRRDVTCRADVTRRCMSRCRRQRSRSPRQRKSKWFLSCLGESELSHTSLAAQLTFST